jgi:gamma-tubulin complex component 5
MEEGYLSARDDFFVQEIKTAGKANVALVWDAYSVRRDPTTGALHNLPKFINSALAAKIFTSGKSVVCLQRLGKYTKSGIAERSMSFDDVCASEDDLDLAPFAERFEAAFAEWVESIHRGTATQLRDTLFRSCGLSSALHALHGLYLACDGSATAAFNSHIFAALDGRKSRWDDAFNLTERVRETFRSTKGVNVDALRVVVEKRQEVEEARRKVSLLQGVKLTYRMPWAVSLILDPATSMPTYQSASTLLLQLARAESSLTTTPIRRLGGQSGPYYSIRARLLWFIGVFRKYLTDIVFEQAVAEMHEHMARAVDVEALREVHSRFVLKLRAQALIGTAGQVVRENVLSILDLACRLEDMRLASTVDKDRTARGFVGDGHDSETDSDSDWDSDSDRRKRKADEGDLSALLEEGSYQDKLVRIRLEYERLLRFVLTGLKAMVRTGKEDNWAVLLEMLDLGMQGARHDEGY